MSDRDALYDKACACSEKWSDANKWLWELGDVHSAIGDLYDRMTTLSESVTGAEAAVELEAIRATINGIVDHLQKIGDSLIGGDYERLNKLTPEEMQAALKSMFKVR